ncbi:phospholipase C type enzyme [Myotisia sp. PD_48]|nr:phospholipase C type enzyme [Myotisia sp. PD_48]
MFSQHSDEAPQKINILTLNCWGLKFISKYRRQRLLEIGRRLANSDYPPEIVGLQECWTQEDYNAIRNETRHILPYGKYYYSGIFGGGLAILSKWPIEESSMFEYPLNGRPTAFFRGDWFVGKGVAYARIRVGPGQNDIAAVFCTHLHAPYEREPHDSYLCHRTAQAWEIAKLMRGSAEKGHLVIGMGDFNMLPLSLAHQLITAHAPVQDVWRYLRPNSSLGASIDQVEIRRQRPVPSGDYNIIENGVTCDGIFNTWRWPKAEQKRLQREGHISVDGNLSDPLGKRLDYIFVSDGSAPNHHPSTSWKWSIDSARVGMMERHPTLHCSLSDHFSVETTLVRTNREGDSRDPARQASNDVEENASFLPIQKNVDSPTGSFSAPSPTLATSASTPKPVLSADIYDEILHMITVYKSRERFQRRARLGHFLASLLVFTGCLVATWWSPRAFISFILCLVSSLSLSAGVIDGLIGGLFIGKELRALKEFEWEVKNARRSVLGMGLDIEEDLRTPKRRGG